MPVRHRGDEIAAEGLVIAHAGFFQQRRIGGEARDPGILRHLHDLRLVGAVGEQFDFQVLQRGRHDRLTFCSLTATDMPADCNRHVRRIHSKFYAQILRSNFTLMGRERKSAYERR